MPAVNITITIDSTEAADILAALEQARFGVTIGEWVALLPADYNTLANVQKAKANLIGLLRVLTRQYRREKTITELVITDPTVS